MTRRKDQPLGQMLAVRTLDALGVMNSCDVISLRVSPDPRARIHAVKLGIDLLADHSNYHSLRESILSCAEDEVGQVRAELALGLSRISGPGVDEAWLKMAPFSFLPGTQRLMRPIVSSTSVKLGQQIWMPLGS